jgi:hypothetical protein
MVAALLNKVMRGSLKYDYEAHRSKPHQSLSTSKTTIKNEDANFEAMQLTHLAAAPVPPLSPDAPAAAG